MLFKVVSPFVQTLLVFIPHLSDARWKKNLSSWLRSKENKLFWLHYQWRTYYCQNQMSVLEKNEKLEGLNLATMEDEKKCHTWISFAKNYEWLLQKVDNHSKTTPTQKSSFWIHLGKRSQNGLSHQIQGTIFNFYE